MLALVLPLSGMTKAQGHIVDSSDILNAGVVYESEGAVLKSCSLRHPTGDANVDEAICGLVERCIAEGMASPEQAAACIKPRIARLAAMVDAGLLAAIPDAEQEARSDDIVVTAKSSMPPPRPGRWVFVESGARLQVAGGDPAQSLRLTRLPTRRWQQCIKDGAVADMLAMMLRESPNEQRQSPCGWTIEVAADRFKGAQRCTVIGALIRGTLVGVQDETTVAARKKSLIRSLSRDPTRSRFNDASSLSASEMSRIDPEPVDGRSDVRGAEYQEDTEVKGHLVGNC